ncbi:MAG: hypothetical protein MUP90_12070, partial [Gammaproteobacteria bacterium]|nr:hypothetical protein [Gammaproteobacteria bacterium]
TWLIHQSAEKAPSIGAEGCHYMDYNRWNGSEVDVLRYFEASEPMGVACPLDGKACFEPVGEMDERAVALHLMMMR